jgi:hypothetical protein
MEQAFEAVFLWSIRHHNSSVTPPHANGEVNPGAIATSSALSRNTLGGHQWRCPLRLLARQSLSGSTSDQPVKRWAMAISDF